MKRTISPAARRLVSRLMERLAQLRMKRSPGQSEADVREAVWADLRAGMDLDDPNCLTPESVHEIIWTLILLIAFERHRARSHD